MLWLLFAGACERADQHPIAKRQHKPCLADGLGPLRPTWKVPEQRCTAEQQGVSRRLCRGDGDQCFAVARAIEADDRTNLESREMFKRACQLGLALGCTNWAASMWTKSDADTSFKCLARVFRRSCDVGEVYSCGMEGRMYLEDPQGAADLVLGDALLERACNEFGGPPCRFLARYIEKGVLGASQRGRIHELMDKACNGGDEDACGKHATVDETFNH